MGWNRPATLHHQKLPSSQKQLLTKVRNHWGCTLTKEINLHPKARGNVIKTYGRAIFFFPSENTTIKKDENFRQEEKIVTGDAAYQGRWMSMLKRQILNNLHSYRSSIFLRNMFCYLYRLRYKISPPSLSFCKVYPHRQCNFSPSVFILVTGPCHLFHLQIKYSLCALPETFIRAIHPWTEEHFKIKREAKSHSFSNWDKDSHIIRPGQ